MARSVSVSFHTYPGARRCLVFPPSGAATVIIPITRASTLSSLLFSDGRTSVELSTDGIFPRPIVAVLQV